MKVAIIAAALVATATATFGPPKEFCEKFCSGKGHWPRDVVARTDPCFFCPKPEPGYPAPSPPPSQPPYGGEPAPSPPPSQPPYHPSPEPAPSPPPSQPPYHPAPAPEPQPGPAPYPGYPGGW